MAKIVFGACSIVRNSSGHTPEVTGGNAVRIEAQRLIERGECRRYIFFPAFQIADAGEGVRHRRFCYHFTESGEGKIGLPAALVRRPEIHSTVFIQPLQTNYDFEFRGRRGAIVSQHE